MTITHTLYIVVGFWKIDLINRLIYSGLDAVGTRIWQLLESEQSVAALRAILLEEYEVSVEPCRRDLLVFLKSLAAQNLIEVRGGESS